MSVVLRDYSTLPKDIVRAYFMPIRNPDFNARSWGIQPFNSTTLSLRLVCKRWKELLDSYDAFWMVIQSQKTHSTYFLSAMALVSEQYLDRLRARKRTRTEKLTSLKGKIVRRQNNLVDTQRELDGLLLSKADLEMDVRCFEEEKDFINAYRKGHKFKVKRKKNDSE